MLVPVGVFKRIACQVKNPVEVNTCFDVFFAALCTFQVLFVFGFNWFEFLGRHSVLGGKKLDFSSFGGRLC